MLRAYRPKERNEASEKLAEEILSLILSRKVTYAEAEDALDAAMEKMMSCTKPVAALSQDGHRAIFSIFDELPTKSAIEQDK